jgi:glyoxylase-like metal-dependent hydrolase (beta-lactamase superfamily II)/rhodanese-related sulfurtransferase
MVHVLAIETPGLGDRSYLAHDGEVAVVVDPQRDYDRVLELADRAGARVTHVFETHIHNDYVTGGLALAREVGAQYLLNADDPVEFDRVGVQDGDVVEVSRTMSVRAVHTPGHTHTHLSFAVESGGDTVAVFTGGSLLYGATGRPDLLGPDHTSTLVRSQWRSARRLADELPDETAVYPTHGFGSFCSADSTGASTTASTVGAERRSNPALTQDEEGYVGKLLAGLDAYPAYYVHMGPANLGGPSAPDLTPPQRAEAEELRQRIEAGEWVVDLRNRKAFAAGHVAGTLNFGLDGEFVTYLGWLIPLGTPVTLLGDSAEEVAEAQREMVRIGIDRPAAMATGPVDGWSATGLASFPRATFRDLADVLAHGHGRGGRPVVLDARRNQERAESFIEGSIHIPIHEVLGRIDEVPAGQVWVHCAGGYRASIVASLLAAHGRDVVTVDDDYSTAAAAGLDVVAADSGVRS